MTDLSSESGLILIVEDDENDIRLIQRAFRKGGLINPVEMVRDGEAALDYLFGRNQYSDRERYPLPMLILLDLKLPRFNGHEILEQMKAEPVLRRIPVVVLTSSSESADINKAYDLGANSYLVKPVHFDEFAKMAHEIHLYWMLLNQSPSASE